MAKKDEKQKPYLRYVFYILSAILFLRLIGSFLPRERFWGFSHAGYLTGLPILYPVLFVIGLFVYQRGFKKPSFAFFKDSPFQKPSLISKFFPFIIILLALVIFYTLAVDSYFLGDGYTLLSNISKQNPILKDRADGEMRIQLLYHRFFSLGDKYDGYRTFRNLSILSGLIFISGIMYYGKKITSGLSSYFAFVILNFLSAITILFYGYIETYSLTSATLFIFFLSGLTALINNKKSLTPIIAFAIAIFLHRICLVYFPALIIYLIYTIGPSRLKETISTRLNKMALILAGLFVLLYIGVKLFAPPFWKIAFLPFAEDRFTLDGYTLFSIKHIIDYFNIIIFLIPVTVILLLLVSLLKEKIFDVGRSNEIPFMIFGAISGLISAFILEPKLGMARDWDLMSTMFIGPLIAGIYFWITKYGKEKQFQIATVLIIIMDLSIFIPWLALNSSRPGLYNYNMAMMELDPKHGRSGFYSIAKMVESTGNKGEVEKIMRYCNRQFPEVALDREGVQSFKQGNYKRSLEFFDRAITANSAWFAPYLDKGYVLNYLKRPMEALEILKVADALNPYSGDTYREIGNAYKLAGDKKNAFKYWNKSLYYGPSDYQTHFAIGEYYLGNNILDSALFYYTALPDSVYPKEVLYHRGVVELKRGDTSKAIDYLNKYLEDGTDSTILQKAQELKKQL